MSKFCKNEDCPPSQALLAYQVGDVEIEEGREIRKHLAVCEFCEAEVEFYSNYPQAEEEVPAPGEIPEPLYELAEALLSDRRDPSGFYNIINDD